MGPSFRSAADVFARYRYLIADSPVEVFYALLLDVKHRYLRDARVSVGILDGSLIHPREVFAPAVAARAGAVILVHNHPSGDPTPSREDMRLTGQLVECAKLLDLRIHDHVVIGRGRYVSLAQRGAV